MQTVEILVIGGGVVGLSIAQELAKQGREVVVCEKETTIGTGVSARNSSVLHAGIYYPEGSLKAAFCRQGAEQLYGFCKGFGVAHSQTGKLIVAACSRESDQLRQIKTQAEAIGADDLQLLGREQIKEFEPALDADAAIFSPLTGIVDVSQLALALQGAFEGYGGDVGLKSEVLFLRPKSGGIEVGFAQGEVLLAKIVINATGLNAQKVAGLVEGLSEKYIPKLFMSKGHYFSLKGPSPFETLIYPVPEKGGLGIHATLDMNGAIRFGPDVLTCSQEDYAIDDSREGAFRAAIQTYYPGIADRDLTPDYIGIRPQLAPPGVFSDFRISDEQDHGVPGLVNLFGIDSPGLTASPMIAAFVADKVQEN
ncbi:MAG: FAD-dependent oxidoreductase [Kordiimonadales bacterium]|nr:MAG: FAD-dependent oxidoreductase [Kordiimonadales bacterium]